MNNIDSKIDSLLSNTNIKNLQNINTKDDKKLRSTCQEFEAIFTKMLLKEMDKTVDRSEDILGSENNSQKIFKDMLYGEYSKIVSKRGSLGISDTLYRQLSHHSSMEKYK